MNHYIEIEEMAASTNTTAENQSSDNMAPWAERLANRIQEECNNWTIPNPLHNANAVPEQKASIFKNSSNKGTVEKLNNKDRAVQLGPYKHHMTEGWLFPETEKRDAFMLVAKVFGLDFKKFIRWISTMIIEVRASYADGSFEMNDEKFAEMLLLDSFFIISAMIVLAQGPYSSLWKKLLEEIEEEPIKNAFKRYIVKSNQEAQDAMGDLLMLENQIPFFVVDYLWVNCYKSIISDNISFKDFALSCFDDYYPRRITSRDTSQFSDCQHLLDLFHWSCVPTDRFKKKANYTQPGLYISTATELRASSVIFEKGKSDCSLDINFSQRYFRTRGVISIPEIHLYGYNRRIIQNLVAFEQAYGLRGYGFTAYVECMVQLVQTEKDVSILRSSGIIASTPMTDRKVIDFYRTIRDEVQVNEIPPDLYELFEQVKNHIKSRPRCPNIWIPISVFTVSIFVLTLLQTVYSMLPGHK